MSDDKSKGHTALPVRLALTDETTIIVANNVHLLTIAGDYDTDDERMAAWAALIVRAVNCHKEPRMSDWQPIETAPKDGARIILAKIIPADEDREAAVWWACAGRWQPERVLSGTGGHIRRQAQWTDGVDNLGEPTHWMPLPAPPKAAEKP